MNLNPRLDSLHDTSASHGSPIGGFFGFHEPDYGEPKQSILSRWTDRREYTAFSNARSALAALIQTISPRAVWLPAYICSGLITKAWQERARFYRLLPEFEPDVSNLDRDALPGDLVLAVDFFGFPPGPEFRQFVSRRSDLLFVDNRAQALHPGVDPWADWTLYSPRKLLGVADGGILVAERPGRQLPAPTEPPDPIAMWTAPILRYEDRTETNNETWYEASKAKQGKLTDDRRSMTRFTEWILSHTTLDPLAEHRRRNWKVLHEYLGNWLALGGHTNAAPFGYLIKVPAERRDDIMRVLHNHRIFAALHYPSLPSPAQHFQAEHELRRRVITLPCDHRYDEAAMRRVAERTLALLS